MSDILFIVIFSSQTDSCIYKHRMRFSNLLLLCFALLCCSTVFAADSVYTGSVDLGEIAKGKVYKSAVASVPLPTSTFQLNAIHVTLMNKSSNAPFSHDSIFLSTVEFSLAGKKVAQFSASNILNPVYFNAPYGLEIKAPLALDTAVMTSNAAPHDIVLTYSIKYSTSTAYTPLTRLATSCQPNYAPFNVPAGKGGFTATHGVEWPQNVNAMAFQAYASQGIISLSFVEATKGTVLCKSTPVVDAKKILQYMTPCNTVVALAKGTTYNTIAVYDNSVARKSVMGNFGLYVGSPHTTTSTTSAGTSTHAATSSTTHAAATSTHAAASSTHSAGSSAGGSSAGGSSDDGGKTSATSSEFTSGPSHDTDSTSGQTSASPTGYSISTGAAAYDFLWDSDRKNVQFY
ncbi:hypothetical protein DFA_02340 [Cavenderia fasciculata]|uniref:Uncharacterized protein n=1 Tax=Cavenderia fasciculata TaxID=261658 RepID=F4PZ65_CACFS|nr:uncharacterized protein DFA_02340 [Cavenderia fasciculata]EGG19094.1 hypothetical protein DFA_02340 [Cavenderia fasciculata]|eukprot:XP_004366727.1 hypothetical protein DFA_02340 [Cavenderia fasciculata]